MNKGWIKLYRTIQDCWIWEATPEEPFSRGSAWVDILLSCNHADKKIMFDGQPYVVKRGEWVTSILKLGERWCWGRKKVSNFLNVLEADGMIEQHRNNKRTLIKVLISLIFLGVLYVTVTLAVFVFNANHLLFGLFNPMSLVIFVIYAVSLWKTPKVEETPEEEKVMESKLTVKQIVILFIIFSILLISASVGVTYLTDWVVQVYNIPGKTFSGALFLGVATSLPELTSTINLSKKKNFDAAFGNIIGSNVFNFLILFIADIFTFIPGKPLYQSEGISTLLLIIFGSISVILMIVSLLIKDKISKHIKAARVYYTVIGTLYVGMYITFLILSNL